MRRKPNNFSFLFLRAQFGKENDVNKTTLAWAACLVFSLVSGMPVQAQSAYPAVPPAPPLYTQQQLDQMLAPVALYPDSLLAQVLMAATYPLEVVQAQRFVEARPGLQGEGLARAVAPMPWDPSVKALVQFPSVLVMLNDRLDWTQQLGQAFLGQQASVMDTVQNLRERARIAGTLESSPQQRVVVQEDVIEIVPVNPQVVYVPYYNPVVVYGDWWWPSAPPVMWAPPPRYRPPSYASGFSASISFGAGIGVMNAVFGDARPDWRQRQVMVNQTRINNVTNVTNVNNTRVVNNVTINQRPVVWHHDARYGGGGRYTHQPAPTLTPPPGPGQAQAAPSWRDHPMPGAQPRPLPVADNVPQRLAQQDQLRQRQAVEQQHQREQQANEQQRQREQMIRQQQYQREQQAQEQRQQQQAQERQWQQRQQETQQQLQHQQQMQQRQLQQQQREQQMRQQETQQQLQRQQQMQQHQLQQQQREQQMRQQLMLNQQHGQQRQMEQAREQARQHQEQGQRQQVQQQARQQQQREQQRDQHPRREERRDERS